jgi:AraC-like DNA-binding protein
VKPIFEKFDTPDDQSFYLEEVVRPYFPDPWHFHTEIEILYIKEAYGTKYIGESIGSFNSGDVVIIGSNTPHVWESHSDFVNPENKLTSSAIVILFLEDIIGKSFSNIPEFNRIKQFLDQSKRGIQFLNKTRDKLIRHIEALSSRTGMNRLIGLLKILDIMATSNEIKYLSAPNYKPIIINSEDKERMEAINRYVIQNYSKNILLEEVASLVNLTPHSFCRYYKSRTGKVFSSFINDVRIGNSCKMLLENKESISQICFESGFNYFSNFNRQFKKRKGMTPSEFQYKFINQEHSIMIDK